MQLMEKLHFNEKGLIPSVIVDVQDGKVLVFRRSQNRLMIKGETSGHIQVVKRVFFDCEGNSLVFMVEQHVAACHAGYKTCYYREYIPKTDSIQVSENKVFDPEKIYK